MFDHRDIDVGSFPQESDEELYRLTVAEYEADHPEVRHVLPEDLETIPLSLFLAAVVASVDRAKLTGHDLVRLLQARERLSSHVDAHFYADIAEIAYACDPDSTDRENTADEFTSEEIQAALGRTRRSADADVALSLNLCRRLPEVWEGLSEGRIDIRRAKVFADELGTVGCSVIPEILAETLPGAGTLTTGQLRAQLKRARLRVDPDAAVDQYRAGLEDRAYVTRPNPDHTASIGIHNVKPEHAVLASEHVHELAMRLKREPGETRTVDQLRADVAIDLLRGIAVEHGGNVTAKVIVHCGAETSHIQGYGPLLPGSTSQLLGEWVIEPHHSGECTHETLSRRPNAAQIEHVTSRYPSCVFPGCRMPSAKCDLDHRVQYSRGGKTACDNLAPLCRHHHVCKDSTTWQLERSADNSHQWTSPLGHTYVTGRPP